MPRHSLSRRQFVFGSAGLAMVARGRAKAALTVQQVIDRLQSNIGVPWKTNTADGLKAGETSMIVTGIATTVMATVDVLRKAAAARQNLVVTQEPVFYT